MASTFSYGGTDGYHMADEGIVTFLTTAQVAKLLGVQLRRVQTLIQQKRLKASKLGRDYLIDTRDLDHLQIKKPGRPPGSGLKQNTVEASKHNSVNCETSPMTRQRRFA